MNDKTLQELGKIEKFGKWKRMSIENLRKISNGTVSAIAVNGWLEETKSLIKRTFISRFICSLRAKNLLCKYNHDTVNFFYCLINGFISIAIMSVIAMWSKNPFVFPSMGPTVFLFFYSPRLPVSSPRNTIMGHFAGIVAGWLSLALFGLLDDGPSIITGINIQRVFATGLSLVLTCAFMGVFGCPHPPAAATTMIVSLGLITSFFGFMCMMLAVFLLTMQAFFINRLAGIDYPVWKTKTAP